MLRQVATIKLTSKHLPIQQFAQQRLYAAAAVAIKSESNYEAGERLTRENVNDIRNLRVTMRDELKIICKNICNAKNLSTKEIAKEIEKIEQWTTLMHQKLHVTHPFADVILHCLNRNLPIAEILYHQYIKSEEFKRLTSNTDDLRLHMFTPGSIFLARQLDSSKLKDDPGKRFQLAFEFLERYLSQSKQFPSIKELIHYLALKEQDSKIIIDIYLALSKNRQDFITKVVEQILSASKMDRLKDLMDCQIKTDADVRIFTNRVTNHLIRKLKSIKLDSASSVSELQTISQVIGAGLKSNGSRTPGGQALSTILASSSISDDILKRVVDYLVNDSKVLVSKSEISHIDTQLRDANLPARAKLLSSLRQKNSTHQRWLKTDNLSDLITEAEKLSENENTKPEVLCALYDVIIRKSVAMQPIALNALVWTLPLFSNCEKKISSMDAKMYRSAFSNALMTAVNYSLLNRNFDAFDKLWELRPFKAYFPDQIILFALSYFERDMHQKADEILNALKESSIDERTLNVVVSSDFVRTLTSEELVKNFIPLLAQHFDISTEWESRLVAAVQLNDLHTSIDEGNLNEVNEKITQMGESVFKDPATSFILIDLLKAAIVSNNSQVFMKSKEFIETRSDPYTLVLYVGLSFLELNDQRWQKMLSKIKHIPTDVLRQLIKRETTAKRADVLHTLFNIMNKPEASSIELEYLLEETIRAYFQEKDLDNLRAVFNDVRNSSFYLSAKLKVKIESNIKMLEKKLNNDGTTPLPPPKSTSPSENSQPLK